MKTSRKTKSNTFASGLLGRSRERLAESRADKARREFNVWAWEQNARGRQVRLGQG